MISVEWRGNTELPRRMTPNTTKNVIDLEVPLGLNLPQLLCRVCSKIIIEPNKPFEHPQCEHVEWAWMSSVSLFPSNLHCNPKSMNLAKGRRRRGLRHPRRVSAGVA